MESHLQMMARERSEDAAKLRMRLPSATARHEGRAGASQVDWSVGCSGVLMVRSSSGMCVGAGNEQ